MKKTEHETPKLSAFQMRVKQFQERHSLKADAIVGPVTWGTVESIETALETATRELNGALDELAACELRGAPASDASLLGLLAVTGGVCALIGLIVGLMF